MSSIARSAADETSGVPVAPPPRSRRLPSFVQDRIYSAILFLASLSIFVVVLGIALELVLASGETLRRFGMSFFSRSAWDPVRQDFGALAFVFGTLYTSFWALLLAVPVSIGAAIFLAEVA